HTRYSRDWSSDVCSSDLDLPRPRPLPKDSLKVITLTALQSEKVALYEAQVAETKQKQNELIVFILDAHNVKIDRVRDLKYNNGRSEERRVGKECREKESE